MRRWLPLLLRALAAVGLHAPPAHATTSRTPGLTIVIVPTGRKPLDEQVAGVSFVASRVERFGIADADVSRHGERIIVRLPGVSDPSVADALVAPVVLEFRPVLANVPATGKQPAGDAAAASDAIESCNITAVAALSTIPTTTFTAARPQTCAVFPVTTNKLSAARELLGPARLTAADVDSTRTNFTSGVGWVVDMSLTKHGLAKFNVLASELFVQSPPANEIAITLDGVVQSSPAVQASKFTGPIQISGHFTKKEIESLTAAIVVGGHPLGLKVQRATVS